MPRRSAKFCARGIARLAGDGLIPHRPAEFSGQHALYGTGPEISDADAILMIEAVVPYITPSAAPRRAAKSSGWTMTRDV